MSSIWSVADSVESDSAAAAAATWKHKYEEQVEMVKMLGSAEQVIQYVYSLQAFRY